jgi:hypothetical protein
MPRMPPRSVDSTGGDAPDKDIVITPAMIEAGAEVAWRTPIMEPDETVIRRMVRDIFRVMLQVSRVHRF